MFGFGSKKKYEAELAEWLAHPSEFGIQPSSVRHKRTYRAVLMHGKFEIHLLDYSMPDGTKGRGFVNSPMTWSFLGDGVNSISDDSLIVAYCGWMWLFPALQSGQVSRDFVSNGEEARYLEQKRQQGISELRVISKYKIGTSELYEFTGEFNGVPVKGAGDTESEVGFAANDPCYSLPAIYFLLGRQVIESLR